MALDLQTLINTIQSAFGPQLAGQLLESAEKGTPFEGAQSVDTSGSQSGKKGGFWEVLTGSKDETLRFPRFTPEQQDALSKILKQGLEGLDFGALEKQARQGFEQQTVPSLAERFTSLGSGSQQSSAFSQSLGQAGAGLESSLAALKSQRALGTLGLGLQPQFESVYKPGQPGFLQQAGSEILKVLPYLIGAL